MTACVLPAGLVANRPPEVVLPEVVPAATFTVTFPLTDDLELHEANATLRAKIDIVICFI